MSQNCCFCDTLPILVKQCRDAKEDLAHKKELQADID